MKTRKADFFIVVREDFEQTPSRVEKVNGEILEVNGRLFGLYTTLLGNNEVVNVYDIKSGAMAATTAIEHFNASTLHQCAVDFDEDLSCGALTEYFKNFTEATQAAYDEHPEIKRQVFG